jgi:endo-1,4-beta-xylanase
MKRVENKMNRRNFLQQASALGFFVSALRRPLAQGPTVPLQRLAAEKGLMFGSCLALKYFLQSSAYQQLFLSQCDIATPELHMKWNSLCSQPGVYDFSNADRFVAFAAANRMKVRGHTLVWHQALPDWVTPQLVTGNGKMIMTGHIRKVA